VASEITSLNGVELNPKLYEAVVSEVDAARIVTKLITQLLPEGTVNKVVAVAVFKSTLVVVERLVGPEKPL
jgi:hypothetical protein